jgi:drug/metabolite transporter (DMT)-like permease
MPARSQTEDVHAAAHRAIALGSAAVLGFSFSLPATTLEVLELDPTFAGLGRAVGAAVLAGVTLMVRREPLPPRQTWAQLAAVSGGVVIAFPLLTAVALKTVPSAHAAVVVGLLPAVTAVFAVMRGGERPRPLSWAGCACGIFAVLAFAVSQGVTKLPRHACCTHYCVGPSRATATAVGCPRFDLDGAKP